MYYEGKLYLHANMPFAYCSVDCLLAHPKYTIIIAWNFGKQLKVKAMSSTNYLLNPNANGNQPKSKGWIAQVSLLLVFLVIILPPFARMLTEFPQDSENYNIIVTHPENVSQDDLNKPIIILFGWAGASKLKMNRYAKMYSKNGYTSVSYTAPWTYIFIGIDQIPGKAQLVSDFLQQDESLQSRDLIFHVFSNLGCAMYQHFSQAFTDTNSFKGIIFDSCPGQAKVKSFFNAMGFVLGGNVVRRKTIPALYFAYLLGRMISSKDFREFPRWWDYLQNNDTIQMPQLYITSLKDECVSSQDVLQMARFKNESGLDVTEKVFQDSDHVSHFDKYPADYEATCLIFLNEILNSSHS